MAIYHLSVKSVSRSTGRSSVAAAAYRAGERLLDERTGELHDFERRKGVLHTEVILPDGGTMSRGDLWNIAEAAEKRKDAKVAREIVVALPCELNQEQQIALVCDYAKGLSSRTGWAIDVAVHAPGREGDQRNVHAHLLCSTRKVERDPSGLPAMGSKTREWDCSSSSSVLIASERSEWGRVVNQAMEREGSKSRVDGRSYMEQGLEFLPQKHLGVHANAMERRGVETERGDYNREVQVHNAQVIQLAEVRDRVAGEKAFLQDLERLERLPLYALEEEARRYYPKSVEYLAYQDPTVKEAYKPLDENQWGLEIETGEVGWLNPTQEYKLEDKLRRASAQLFHAKNDEETWRRVHPVKAKLYDLGLPNQELRELADNRKGLQQDYDGLLKEKEAFLVARQAAKNRLDEAFEKAMPKVVKENALQQERYERVKQVLENRRTLEQGNEKEQSQGMER